MKRWGLRASSLTAYTKADAGQTISNKHLTPNILYMMLAGRFLFLLNFFYLNDFTVNPWSTRLIQTNLLILYINSVSCPKSYYIFQFNN